MRQGTVILIISALCCLEDHGAQGRLWNLPRVMAKFLLRQPYQDTPSQGTRHIWTYSMRPHTSAGNVVKRDRGLEGHWEGGTKAFQ